MKQNIFPSDHSDETRRRDITENFKKEKKNESYLNNLKFVFAALSEQNRLRIQKSKMDLIHKYTIS